MAPAARYLATQVRTDLAKKMVFVAGPRQVGKTTMARALPGGNAGYLNWDALDDRSRILARALPPGRLWVFDELHKYRQWRGLLKGLFDRRPPGQQILVTGSGRLDFYRHGGDSLQGRYHLLRLHPFSAGELALSTAAELKSLLTLGGFPEPWLGGSAVAARRWSRQYASRLIHDDVASLERVADLGSLELLTQRLPALVGSLLSVNAIREELQLPYRTVAGWLDVLERLFVIFRVQPFGAPRIRAIKKAAKHYHWDWAQVEDAGPRFENLVASHLLKLIHFEQDTAGRDLELRYFRDTDGREVDFVVTERRTPILLVECKSSDRDVSTSLRYLKMKYPAAAAWQLSAEGKRDYQSPEGIRVAPALTYLRTLI